VHGKNTVHVVHIVHIVHFRALLTGAPISKGALIIGQG